MKFRGEKTAVANDRMSLMSDRDEFDDLTEIGNSQYGGNDHNIRDEEEVKPTKTSYAVDDAEYGDEVGYSLIIAFRGRNTGRVFKRLLFKMSLLQFPAAVGLLVLAGLTGDYYDIEIL